MAFSVSDTIVAIATPPGRGGIGVVRLSGPGAKAIAGALLAHRVELEPRRATLTRITAPAFSLPPSSGAPVATSSTTATTIDQAVATYFPAPHSYTGDDVVELSAHGSPVVLRLIVSAAVAAGARLAEAGEFTLRAFLNGRIDLMQAEAVADLIDAVTPLQARAAFDQLDGTLTRTIAEIDASLFDLIAKLEASIDFPDEGYHFVEPAEVAGAIAQLVQRTASLLRDARRGRIIRDGLQVAIVGKPNVGKSSIFNALVGAPRAIVTETPGTTRDLVTETIDLHGLRVTLVDTAGLRETADAVEAEGVSRSVRAQAVADLVVQVVDGDAGADAINTKNFTVQNKIDIDGARICDAACVRVSALTGEGLDELRHAIVSALDVDLQRDRPEITNVRHAALVQRAHDALSRALDGARADGGALPEEFLLADLQEARAALEEVTGRRASDEVLAHIFARFCVGK
jgi:tRNA modification GTPase